MAPFVLALRRPRRASEAPPSNFERHSSNTNLWSTMNLITPAAAAVELGVSEKTLSKWRCQGKGPPFQRHGHDCVRYDHAAVIEWRSRQPKTVRYLSLSADAQVNSVGGP